MRSDASAMAKGRNHQEIWPDGAPVTWVLTLKSPLRDPAGKLSARLAALTRDITERKRAQEELNRFFALSLDFLCIASADGYMKRVSPAVTDILGWSAEEFQARPFINFVHPDDQAATLHEVERQVIAGEKVLLFENRYQHKGRFLACAVMAVNSTARRVDVCHGARHHRAEGMGGRTKPDVIEKTK